MARLKVCVRGQSVPTDPSRTFPGAERHPGVSATGLRPSNGTSKENDKPVLVVGNFTASHAQDSIPRPPRLQLPIVHVKTEQTFNSARPQLPMKQVKTEEEFNSAARPPAKPVKTEQNFNPTLEEKRSLETPVSATSFWTFPAAEGQQATAPAAWPSTLTPPKEKLSHGAGGRIPLLSDVLWQQRAHQQEANQSLRGPRAPAPASISAAAVAVNKPRAARGLQLSIADLVSDAHLLLKEKAEKLGVSLTFLKNRRNSAKLGRWPGRAVRAAMKREEAQARRA